MHFRNLTLISALCSVVTFGSLTRAADEPIRLQPAASPQGSATAPQGTANAIDEGQPAARTAPTADSNATPRSPRARYESRPVDSDDWQHKQFEFLLTPFGVGPYGTVTHALSAGIYLEERTALVFEGGFLTPFIDSDRDNLKGTSFGLSVKQFTGRSFYLRGGLNYQHASVSATHGDLFDDNSRTTDIFGLSFAIGNQWQIRNFAIGCQWIGTIIPIARRDVSSSGSISDSYATDMQFEVLRFFLGFAF